jgi:hypothetical protein
MSVYRDLHHRYVQALQGDRALTFSEFVTHLFEEG